MEVYCVFQVSVYRHSCFGVFDSLDKAISAAKETAKNDIDDHHMYEVVPYSLNYPLPFGKKGALGSYAVEKGAIFETSKSKEG